MLFQTLSISLRKLCFLGMLFAAPFALGHDSNTLTLLLQQDANGVHTCRIMTPWRNLDNAMQSYDPSTTDLEIASNPYKRAMIDFIKSEIVIIPKTLMKGEIGRPLPALELGTAILRLGNHQTDVIFEITNFPNLPIKGYDVHLRIGKDNPKQTNVFRYFDGQNRGQITLRHAQAFSGQLALSRQIWVCLDGNFNTESCAPPK